MLIKLFNRLKELGVSGCIQAVDRMAKRRWIRICYKRFLFNPWILKQVPRLRPSLSAQVAPRDRSWLRRAQQDDKTAQLINLRLKRLLMIFSGEMAPHCINQKTTTPKSIDTNFLGEIIKSEEFNLYLPTKFKDNNWILQQADLAVSNCFDILGSGIKCFEKIPWHSDFKSENFSQKTNSLEAKAKSWQQSFYQDITAACPNKMALDEYNPDIKVPWELSRFQHIFVLGRAYQINQNNRYASAFQTQISDWIKQNPYMIGVNWVCPMDVAIRAINWIWGFYFFKDAQNIPDEFWIKFINTLYMHLHYLEFNWETSDKPNNHYLSNLVGYLYLCEFFKIKKSKTWCVKKILEQFFHQVHPDGTCYEGTTGYHKLDTELFLHFKLICDNQPESVSNSSLPDTFLNRFDKMIEFLQACTDKSGSNTSGTGPSGVGISGPYPSDYFVTIGDNDSGKILTGIEIPSTKIPDSANKQSTLYNYPDFGLVIIKTYQHEEYTHGKCLHEKCLHVTYRLPKFKQNQPSGHFHYDQLAVTLSINGTPILIDPGSYVYTANSTWRNLMRSPQSHNTFYSPELTTMQDEMFQLKLTPQDNPVIIDKNNNIIHVTACNKFDFYGDKMAYRTVEIDEYKNLKLTDWWEIAPKNSKDKINSEWNLIFNPELKLKKEDNKSWSVEKNNKSICRIFSTLDFVILTDFYSKNYGILQTCTKLKATKFLSNEKQIILIKSC